jgi:plasmid stabilization system protein ParE
MTVAYTMTALAEIGEILSFIAADNPKAAANVAGEIEDTVLRIKGNPQLAPVVYKKNVRAVVLGRFNYRVFYSISGDGIIIRNVRSSKRKRPWD